MTDLDLPAPIEVVLSASDYGPGTRLVLGALYAADGPRTAAELAERTGFSQKTTKQAAETLADAGRVRVGTRTTGGRGRPPKTYRLRIECPDCDESYLGKQGVGAHYSRAHELSPNDLIGRAGEFGEDPSPPPMPGETDD